MQGILPKAQPLAEASRRQKESNTVTVNTWPGKDNDQGYQKCCARRASDQHREVTQLQTSAEARKKHLGSLEGGELRERAEHKSTALLKSR